MGPPWGTALRCLRYPVALIRDWLQGQVNIRAMSLAYTTLLSIVPLLVFSFAILKGLGARGDLRVILREFFKPLGDTADQMTTSTLQFVANMRGELLGSLGLAFLVYTVIDTIRKVEASFNFIWRVERPRSFARRFSEYLSLMIAGPILLAVVLGLLGSAAQSPFAAWLNDVAPLAAALRFFGQLLPYLLVTTVFTFMYSFIPNTRVEFRAALIGGVTAGIIWALVGKVFAAFIVYSSQMVAIYTGFAVVLTMLIWVYLSWLILLIGAQLAFYVQFPQYLRHGEVPIDVTGSDRETAALSIMYLIGRDYAAGKAYWNLARIAAELDVPSLALSPVLAHLERGGLIAATEKEQFLPGRDPQGILLSDILDAVRTHDVGHLAVGVKAVPAAAAVMSTIEAGMRAGTAAQSLKDLINSTAP